MSEYSIGARSPARPVIGDPGLPRRALFQGAGVAAAAGLLGACSARGEAEYTPAGQVSRAPSQRILGAFDDPVLELGRLLKEAAEIEHDLMVQYLYAAFSLKPRYADVAGSGAPTADTLLGVAVQEMQHLRAVNQLLSELGYAPVLSRHDFPEEVSIYPFAFRLEPMSRESLAKYVFCEAPTDVLTPHRQEDELFIQKLTLAIGANPRPNHVGSLYDAVITSVQEVAAKSNLLGNVDGWLAALEQIKGEGERDHYHFFRKLFMSEHPSFASHGDVWELDKSDPNYPSLNLPIDPTAYPGHPNSIAVPFVRKLAWLGNLTYWLTLALIDLGYRGDAAEGPMLAQTLMQGPLAALARELPLQGGAMPFDPLSMGASPGANRASNLAMASRIAREAIATAGACRPHLPSRFPADLYETVNDQLHQWSANT